MTPDADAICVTSMACPATKSAAVAEPALNPRSRVRRRLTVRCDGWSVVVGRVRVTRLVIRNDGDDIRIKLNSRQNLIIIITIEE